LQEEWEETSTDNDRPNRVSENIIPPPPEFSDGFYLDTSSTQQNPMANIHHTNRQIDITCPETLYLDGDSITPDHTTTINRSPPISRRISYTSSSPGTSFQNIVSSPNISLDRGRNDDIDIINQHFVPNDKTENNISTNPNPQHNTREHSNPRRKRKQSWSSILNPTHNNTSNDTTGDQKKNKEEYLSSEPPDTPVWKIPVIELLKHHRLPQLETPMEKMIQITPINKPPTHSLYTKQDSTTSPPPQKKARHSPHSTTATTTTSSSPQNIQTTVPDISTPSLTSFTPILKELQKQILHYNQSSSSRDSYRISFVKVSEASTNMELEYFTSSNH
jgi:hypothetical protein